MKDRLELAALVGKMISDGKASLEIVDTVIAELAPDDGDDCPVCGICP